MEVILPSTDAGVAAQALAAGIVFGAALLATRRSPELRRFVTGVAVMTLALFGLRAMH